MNQTMQSLLEKGIKALEERGIPEPALDARYLLLEAFEMDTAHFLLERSRPLPQEEKTRERVRRYQEMIKQREMRVPLQQILGNQEFMGLNFQVNHHVLIPRQDTETLVELVLNEQKDKHASILDMCTGSGCIAVSLAALGGYERVAAVDLSGEALKVAEENRNRILWEEGKGRVSFFQGDLFQALDRNMSPFHILVSNPPYIPTSVIGGLEPEVRDFEPRMALDGSQDGLMFYRRIARESQPYLCPQAAVYLEIGWDQGRAVKEILEENGFCQVRVIKDAPGKDRVAAAVWPGESE